MDLPPLVPVLAPGEAARLWRRRDSPRVDRAPRRIPELTVLLCAGGRVRYFVDGTLHVLGARALLVAPPERPHFLVTESAEADVLVGSFARRIVDEDVRPPLPGAGDAPRRLAPDAMVELERLGDRVARSPLPARAHGARWWLHRAMLHWRASPPVADAAAHPAVARAVALLKDRPELAISEVARRAGLSATHLGRLFRAETGTSMIRYRTGRRIDRVAAALHGDPDAPLLGLALDAGFSDYSAFYRACLRETGAPPSALGGRLAED